jgi:hypothetical protein
VLQQLVQQLFRLLVRHPDHAHRVRGVVERLPPVLRDRAHQHLRRACIRGRNARTGHWAGAKAKLEALALREADAAPVLQAVEYLVNELRTPVPEGWNRLGTNVDLRDALLANIPLARVFIRKFLDGGYIVVRPFPLETTDGKKAVRVEFSATGRLDAYLAAVIARGDASTSELVPSPGSRCPRSGGRPPSSAQEPDRGSCALPRDRGRRAAPWSP